MVLDPDEVPAWDGTTIGRLCFLAGQQADRAYSDSLRPLGLRPAEFRILSYIGQRSSCAQTDVATALASDPGNLGTTITRLCDQGWIAREREPLNQRRYALSLAPGGAHQLRRAQDAIAAAERDLVAAFTPEQSLTLRTMLAQLTLPGPV